MYINWSNSKNYLLIFPSSNRFSQAALETRKAYNEENVEDSNNAIPLRLFWPSIGKVVTDITDLLLGRALTLPRKCQPKLNSEHKRF